eukprot:Nitzschia sp. Nitz4//scaffold20_size174350//16316//17167//NITZ4_002078-RA/size174350-processed-gene-0.85-mRNA-1//-1//CDS//3329541737//7356//frame0
MSQPNSLYLEKHRDRKNFLLSLSFTPILICVLAFARSAVYRIMYTPPECSRFGWFSSSSGEFTCDHKPLDFHATLALAWLGVFSLQVALMAFGQNRLHKLFGKVGFAIAFLNAGGMFWLAIHDTLHPMEKTDRPSDFTPFMFLVAVKLTLCLIFAVAAVVSKTYYDIENHFIWIFRGFITSFTTPVIRFYPAVLRHLAGQDCFEANRGKFVMGAMFVSELTCVVLYSLAQLRTRREFWDTFMKLQVLTFLAAAVKEYQFAEDHGLFISGMIGCAAEKYGFMQS